jgi:iron complex transport system permease protein
MMFRPQARVTPERTVGVLSLLLIALVLFSLIALSHGAVNFSFSEVWNSIVAGEGEESAAVILRGIRLPRVLLAIIIGAGLSVAGATFQALLRNVLAEPYILGISSGGAAGAVLAVVLNLGFANLTVPLFSLVGSGSVMILVYGLGHRRGFMDPNALLLSGVMAGAFFNAIILLLVSLFNQETRTAYLWLLGNLGSADYPALILVSTPVIVACVILFFSARALNLMAMGEETAAFLGAEVDILKRRSYFLASLITGLAVSVSGVIGFVGLIVPHLCRLLFGADHRLLLPASFLAGAIFLVVCDLVSRVVLAPTEIPVGAITAVLGVPVFVYLLKRRG